METNVRYFRKKINMTLEDLSEKSGLSTAYLSLIERGMREPTLLTLRKIASALHVSAEALWSNMAEDPLTRPSSACTLVRNDQRTEKELFPGVNYSCLTENPLVNGRNVGLIGHYSKLDPGCDTNPDGMVFHDVDGFTYVLSGTFTYIFDGSEETVSAGDTIVIHKDALHKFVNRTDKPAEYIMVRYVNA